MVHQLPDPFDLFARTDENDLVVGSKDTLGGRKDKVFPARGTNGDNVGPESVVLRNLGNRVVTKQRGLGNHELLKG